MKLADYVFLNNKKIAIEKARIFFGKLYPHIKLCAGGIDTMETYEELKLTGGYQLYEGEFYRNLLILLHSLDAHAFNELETFHHCRSVILPGSQQQRIQKMIILLGEDGVCLYCHVSVKKRHQSY